MSKSPNRTPDEHESQFERRPRHNRRQQISSLQIVFAAILSLGLLLVINFSGRIARGQQMDAERRRLQSTIDVMATQKLDLLQERDYTANDAYVEFWAHTEGKMVRDGEVLVIPIPAGAASNPTPAPPGPVLITTPSPERGVPRWHLWWNLFFDGEPPF